MTQQNCRPCQGLESLTPLLPRNRAGQSSLNYRVGTYNEFFQSMLAGLSRGRTATANLRSPLRLLTAREKDDPSIAMLDAWAILADVLTFYNERTIDETFLRTATQASSLHELANLVGYLPRPGLSSSAYLAFEVDDRGSEVLVPKGTPARSTPVPGSGETSETFETSADLVGRPSFNKIRPRLSRPHDLRQISLIDLKRLYLKGTGLRIQPNDLIAVGARELDLPKLKKVIKVEERRDTVRGPLTVLSLELDILAPSRLVEEVQAAITRFFEDTATNNLIDSVTVTSAFDDYKSVIDQLTAEARELGLSHADQKITQELLINRIISTSSPLRNIAEQLHRNFIDSSTNLKDRSVKAKDEALTAYKQRHTKLSGLIDDRIALLPSTVAHDDTDSILVIEKLAYSIESPVARPVLYHALKKSRPVIAAGGRVFDDIKFSDGPNLPGTPDFKVEYGFSGTAGPILDGADGTLDGIKQSVQDRTVQGDGYAYFHIFHDDGSTVRFIAAGIQYFDDNTNDPVLTIKSPEKTQFVRPAATLRVDADFELSTSNTDGDFSYVITVLEGQGTLSGDSGSGLHASQVQDAITNATYDRAGLEKRASLLITLKKGTNTVAFALRTLVFDEEPIFTRSQVARIIADPSPATLRDVKTRFENERDIALAAGTMTDDTSLVGKSETLSGDLRADKYQLSASAALESIKEATDKLRNTIGKIGTDRQAEIATLSELQLAEAASAAASLAPPLPTSFSNLLVEFNSLISALDRASVLTSDVYRKFFAMANDIHTALNERRKIVIERLEASKSFAMTALIGSTAAPDVTARTRLETLFETPGTGPTSLKWRLSEISTLVLDRTTTLSQLNSIAATLENIIKDSETVLKALDPDVLTPIAATKVRQLRQNWAELLYSIKMPEQPQPPQPVGKIESVSDLMTQAQKLFASGSVFTSALAGLLEADSSVWQQVVSALDPARRKELLSYVGNVTFRGTPRDGNVGVWVFRSHANLFGWNSPGQLSSETTHSTTTTVTTTPPSTTITDSTKTVTTSLRNDPPADFSASHLKDTEVIVDGKLSKTLAGAPIGIKLQSLEYPSGFWSGEVSFAPHTAYGISNESTKIILDPPTTWYSNQTFETIRHTKVLCDAELLALAEELIADSSSGFQVPESRAPNEIKLDGFYPELAAGMWVVLSGIACNGNYGERSQPERDDPNEVITSRLAQVQKVQHVSPSIPGETAKTTIVFQDLHGLKFWRNTLEICANVVEATHGETVIETLGNGDARKPFQRFRLSRAPLTRLPAVTPSGKQEALEVYVNQTKWDHDDQLVGASPHSESYELRGNRQDATTTVQFGDGEHGARLPTGIENVKATYRAGLGAAGNVASEQINQLPSPPFGVKSVTNPLSGDGGTDADTVSQTRVRIPALPASIGRIVSKRDYENFALLFAGIDKVAVDDQNGQLVIYVAGPSPAPLSATGQLLTNLTRALAELGDPDAQVEIQPHTGLLLHIKAKVSIDARHEWAPVAEAINRALLDRFGYTNASLGKDILASEVINTIQSVEKVNYVVLEELLGLASSEKPGRLSDSRRSSGSPGGGTPSSHPPLKRVDVFIDEVCYIDSKVSSTVQLERI